MRFFGFIVFFLYLPIACLSQTYTGIIVDAQSGQPMAYVNVGVNGKDIGVLSNEAGHFEIDLSSAAADDSLYITSLGYELEVIPVKALTGGILGIRLYHRDYYLKEVNIGGLRMQSREKFGRPKPTKATTLYEQDAGLGQGQEWGIRIENGGERYLLQDINFHLKLNTADSALFRVNIYGLYGDMPGESILRKPIFVRAFKGRKWVTSDLASSNVIIDEPVIVALELINVWSDDTSVEIHVSHGEGYESGESFGRSSSFAYWERNEHPPLTLYLTGRVF
ncbi:MAG: carboxypeptidase-like regulatory domain-containing protein [Bacteroidota bacterium]